MAIRVQTTVQTVQNVLGTFAGWMHDRSPREDRLSYLWLALGLALFPFATLRWTIPLAAWLVPVFWLRFVRTQPLLRGVLWLLLTSVLGFEVVLIGLLEPMPLAMTVLLGALVGVLSTLPYLIDRLMAARLGGLLGTLAFPLAVTSWAYLSSVLNPIAGTWGNPAYTQYGDLPLLQLMSVTGLWGIVFLMSWFASLVNWAWERAFAWPKVRAGALLYGGLFALILLFGGARLALFPAQAATVRVAGVSPARAISSAASQQFARQVPQQAWMTLMSGMASPAQIDHARQVVASGFAKTYAPVNDDLLALSDQEARDGAKIIIWPEGAANVLQEDEAALLARASTLAHATGVYLDMGMGVLLQHPVQSEMFLDQIVLMDPGGNVVWRYEKVHLVGGSETGMIVPGVDHVPTVQTPYGRISNVVCFDADFPGTLRQAGQSGADIMLVPSNDWRAIDPIHTQMITYRAIENGYSLVRPTSNGLSMTVDYEGNVLAASDYFTSDPQIMVAFVPLHGVRTLYAVIGDLLGWLSLVGLVGLIGVIIARQRRRDVRQVGATAPTHLSSSPPSVT